MSEPNACPLPTPTTGAISSASSRAMRLSSADRLDRLGERRLRLRARALIVLVAALTLMAGYALAQGDDRPTIEEAGGHVATFEVVARSATSGAGASLNVLVEVDGIESPNLVLVGPNGTLLRESDGDASFEDLPPGEYLVAATAHRMRLVSGTVTVADGEEIYLLLRLFNLPVYYADESETRILGIFSLDVADNDEEERGAIELLASSSAKMVVVGSNGYVETFLAGAETRIFEALEPGLYIVATTGESHALAVTTVVVGVGERVTVAVDLESDRP